MDPPLVIPEKVGSGQQRVANIPPSPGQPVGWLVSPAKGRGASLHGAKVFPNGWEPDLGRWIVSYRGGHDIASRGMTTILYFSIFPKSRIFLLFCQKILSGGFNPRFFQPGALYAKEKEREFALGHFRETG